MKRTFQQFIKEVNRQVSARCGMGIGDLPDIDFHDFWWQGIDEADWDHAVQGAAEEALERAGFEGEAI